MRERILKLCKRLDKFTLDEITMISEIEEDELLPVLNELISENSIILRNETYFYCKKSSKSNQRIRLPQFFQHHSKTDIDYIIKGFCADLEVIKMIDLFGISKHVMNNFYQHLRTVIYEQQLAELKIHFDKTPKIPQERVYMNTKAYLYLYEHKLYISEKYIVSKDARKHTNDERLEIKNIYLRSYRKVLSSSFAHKFHLHLAEEIWKYGKGFQQRIKLLNDILTN